jgi:F-type H+-transporting ATPase subunit gamma
MSVVSLKTPTGTASEPRDERDEDKALGLFLDNKKHLVLVITTDKGLCGSVNSSLTRALRKDLNAAEKAGSDVRLVVLGDKGRAQIARDYAPAVARVIDSYLDRDPIFPLASNIASKVLAEPYDVLTIWYNHYENQIKFHNVYKQIPQYAGLKPGTVIPGLKGYEIEPDNEAETLTNMQEYAVASSIFYALLETVACETSQRVTAMENASTNAKDMVDRFKLIYNRARQAKITTELTEIISGSESLVVATVSD